MMIKVRFFQIFSCMLLAVFQLTADVSKTDLSPIPSATVHIPMRDGTELTADLYYPSETSVITNEHPCILIRLPAGRKAESWLPLANLAKHGYVVAIQDTRSALDPEGKTFPYFSDGWGVQQDGLDTVNWLAASSFTNGKIGTIGFSAAGMTQAMLAPTAPPSLKCQYIGQTAGSMFHHATFLGGQMQKNQVETWLSYNGSHPSVYEYISGQPTYNEFWKEVDAVSMAHQVEVPAVHYGGWFDPFSEGTIDSFVARQNNGKEGAKDNQKLLLGPWNHFWPKDLTIGDYPVPENGKHAPVDISATRWFDFYLKGIDNKIAEVPAVTYYVMGALDGTPSSGNLWRHSDVWPVPAVETSYYLTAEKTLSEKISKKTADLKYKSDPNDPVPTIGGRNLFLPSGPKDQRAIEERKDVIVFTSAPLPDDVEMTGRIVAKLFFTSSVPDTDIAVRLTDVYPDGKSLLIAEGLIRTGVMYPVGISEKTPKEVEVDLYSTSVVFAKGHALRVSVAGSNYPRYEKNLHITVGSDKGSIPTVAQCGVHVGELYPSRVILPVVRVGERWLVKPQFEDKEVAGEDIL